MISDMNKVYQRVVDKHGVDYKLVKSIGDSMFKYTKDRMLSFQDCSIYLPHVGSFVLKSRKIERQLVRYLSYRKYKISIFPDVLHKPIGKKVKMFFDVYLNVIVPFKRKKKKMSEIQVEYCKNVYKSYEKDNN